MTSIRFSVLLASLLLVGCAQPIDTSTASLFPLVEMYKFSGSVQCEPDSGTSLAEMKLELESNDVEVLYSSCGNDGLGRIMVCGASTGDFFVFSINPHDQADAESMGYRPLNLLGNPARPEHRVFECRQNPGDTRRNFHPYSKNGVRAIGVGPS